MAHCAACHRTFEIESDLQDRKPCLECGSTRRRIEGTGNIRLSPLKALMKFRTRPPQASWSNGSKEFVVGDEQSVKTGKWNEKFRCIDHPGNRYVEIVKDLETGEVIHQCIENLSDHLGHGSDKRNQ